MRVRAGWKWAMVLLVLVLVSFTAGVATAMIPGYPVLDIRAREGYLIRCLPNEGEDHQPFPILFEQKPGNAYLVCVTR